MARGESTRASMTSLLARQWLSNLPDVASPSSASSSSPAGSLLADSPIAAAARLASEIVNDLRGLDALPSVRQKKRSAVLGVFVGDMYRGRAHSHDLHECKRAKLEHTARVAEGNDKRKIASVWNANRLRLGDKVLDDDDNTQRELHNHPNTYDPAVVMQEGWKQIGSSANNGVVWTPCPRSS